MICSAFPEGQEGYLPWRFVWQSGKVTTPRGVPSQRGHFTLKKEGSQASQMNPVFPYAFYAFQMLTTAESHCTREFTAFAEQCSIKVSWSLLAEPGGPWNGQVSLTIPAA